MRNEDYSVIKIFDNFKFGNNKFTYMRCINNKVTKKEVLYDWENKKGNYIPNFDEMLSFKFRYVTNPFKNTNLDEPYEYVTPMFRSLSSKPQNIEVFEEYFNFHRKWTENKNNFINLLMSDDFSIPDNFLIMNDWAISFKSKSGAILIIPKLEIENDYSNIYNYTISASVIAKKNFWCLVSIILKSLLNNNDNDIYVNSHGSDVNYFHLRIDYRLDNVRYVFVENLSFSGLNFSTLKSNKFSNESIEGNVDTLSKEDLENTLKLMKL